MGGRALVEGVYCKTIQLVNSEKWLIFAEPKTYLLFEHLNFVAAIGG